MSKSKNKEPFTADSILSRTLAENLGAPNPSLADQMLNPPGSKLANSVDQEQTPGATPLPDAAGEEASNGGETPTGKLDSQGETGDQDNIGNGGVSPNGSDGDIAQPGSEQSGAAKKEPPKGTQAKNGGEAPPPSPKGAKAIKAREYQEFGKASEGIKKHSHYSTDRTAELLDRVRRQLFPKTAKNDFIENILKGHLEQYLPQINKQYEQMTNGAIKTLITLEELNGAIV